MRRRPTKRVTRVLVAIAVAVATAIGGYAISDAAGAQSDAVRGPGLVKVDVNIHYSKFSFTTLKVRPGTLVEFVVHNDDPIHHEFIVGDESVHARHERGRESAHPPVPGEVSVGPNGVGATFFRFDKPGRYFFACHLPGHLAFGIRGWVVVDQAP